MLIKPKIQALKILAACAGCANEYAKEKEEEEEKEKKEKNITTLVICHGTLLTTTGDYLRSDVLV